ncbi:MAG: hypothetical protein V4520_14025 [Bacteroidota bacterium]
MRAIKGIKSGISNKDNSDLIAKKLYLSYYTEVFKNNEDKEFYIKNSISKEFDIPFSSIAISGSSKTGLSFFKDKLFVPGESDLDIAIISLPLFNKFSEISNEVTKGYSDLSTFPIYKKSPTNGQFKYNLMKGYINPFFMPNCPFKTKWLTYFNTLSNSHFDLFKNINGCIYASEYFFQYKQIECIEQYLINSEKYDKISGTV